MIPVSQIKNVLANKNMPREISFKGLIRHQSGKTEWIYYGISSKPSIFEFISPDLQYTGQKDSNDEKIYEDDYISWKNKKGITKRYQVRFNEDYAGYAIERNLVDDGENHMEWFYCDIACRSNIVGNFHQK
jgi:hypothetical protein